VFTAMLPSSPEEGQDYSTYYDRGNLDVPSFIERRLDQLVADFDRYRLRNRWLDVGCGAGALMRAAAKQSWTAIGTEVSAPAANSVRSQGFDVRLGELETLGLEPGSFDVLSAIEVLEHVPDPGALVRTAARLVRPGGAVYLTTPHGRGISARLLRGRWSVMSPPEHLQLFSTNGLTRLLTGAGLQLDSVQTHAVNPYELLAALRRSDTGQPFERVPSAYKLNESLTSRRTGRAAKAALNAALSTLRLGDTLKVTARTPG
jgi:SAM-dependent methyltransferase